MAKHSYNIKGYRIACIVLTKDVETEAIKGNTCASTLAFHIKRQELEFIPACTKKPF